MMFKLLLAFLAVGTQAFSPAAAGSLVTQSRVAPQPHMYASPLAGAPSRAVVPTRSDQSQITMSEEILYEMFDPIYVGIVLLPFLALLITNPF